MSQGSTRVLLILLFLLTSIVIWQKESLFIKPTIRESRSRENADVELVYPHVGELKKLKVEEKREFSHSNLLDWLSFDKKINTYVFTFYNWYHFELEFVDLTYESYIEFRSFTEDHLHDRWKERVGFKLDESFYPKGGRVKLANPSHKNCTGCKCTEKGMNFDISSNIMNLTVRQYTVQNLSDDRHDGYKYSRFWYYTPNKTLDNAENEAFKSDLTITTFNISYRSENHQL